jgi:hypothetical protein
LDGATCKHGSGFVGAGGDHRAFSRRDMGSSYPGELWLCGDLPDRDDGKRRSSASRRDNSGQCRRLRRHPSGIEYKPWRCQAIASRLEHLMTMTPAQYRDAIAHLGLTQVAAGRLLGIDDRTSRRRARTGVRGTCEILLRLLLTGRITPADINYGRRDRSTLPNLRLPQSRTTRPIYWTTAEG